MPGPFEIAVGALTVVDFGLKLYNALSTFVAKVKYAGQTADGLAQTVDSLHRQLFMVYLILKGRKEQLRDEEPQREEEKWVWVNISETFTSWRHTLRLFKETVDRLDIGPAGQGVSWLGRALWVLEHDRSSPLLRTFQSDIARHESELRMSLLCFNA